MTFLNVPTDRAVKPEVWKSVIKRTQEISMEKNGDWRDVLKISFGRYPI